MTTAKRNPGLRILAGDAFVINTPEGIPLMRGKHRVMNAAILQYL